MKNKITAWFINKMSGIFSLLMLVSPGFMAQENLSLSVAIESSLKNNFFITTVRIDEQIAKNNNTFGNAGFLPSVDASAGISTTTNNTEQEFSSSEMIKQKGVRTDNLNAGAQLNWTLFDGLRMFAAKSRLNQQEEASGLYLKVEIENIVSQVIGVYFNVVRILQQIKVLEENIKIYEDRELIAKTRFDIGSASRLDFLQAKVDRNEKLSEILSLKEEYNTSIADLNRLMGKTDFTDYNLTDSVTIAYSPTYEDLRKTVLTNNSEINLSNKYTGIFESTVREMQSQRFPQLDLNVNYNFSRIENEAGFTLLNDNRGLTTGVILSWNLFNGFNTGREIQNAKLNLQSTQLLLADTRSKIDRDLFVAFNRFQSEKEILQLEESNLEFARENVTVALEAYRLGSISGLQLKEAQNSYESSFSRLVEARYRTKLSETELMRLNGELVK